MSEQDDSTVDRFNQLERLINERFDSLEQSNIQINAQLLTRKTTVDIITQENRQLQKRVKTLEQRLITLEKQFNNTDQNHRKNNVEIDGVPSSVGDDDLRAVVATLINHVVDSDVAVDDIEVAHRLFSKSTPKPTIVRLKRNIIQELRSKEAKTKLKAVADRMGFPRGTKIYVNDNLSPNMRSLAYNARVLKSHKLIAETWFSNAAVRIKRSPTSKPIKVTHEKDLVDLFPDFEYFTFDMDFHRQIAENEDVERYDSLWGADSDDGSDFDFDPPKRSNIGAPSVDLAIHSFKNAVPPTDAKIDEVMKAIAAISSKHDSSISSTLPGIGKPPPNDTLSAGVPTPQGAGIELGTITALVNTANTLESPVNLGGVTTIPVTSPSSSAAVDPSMVRSPLISPQDVQLKPKNPHITRSTTKSLSATLFKDKTQ